MYRVAIDTGGTFTDVVAIDEAAGRTYVTKTPSTPREPWVALMDGVRKIAAEAGGELGGVSTLIHGTTTATNALLEGRFDRLGLIVTRGFRHLLEIARQSVPDGYGNSYFWVKPPRIVALERVEEVGGRMDHHGAELDRARLATTCAPPASASPGSAWTASRSACCTPTPTPPTSCASASCCASRCRTRSCRCPARCCPSTASTSAR